MGAAVPNRKPVSRAWAQFAEDAVCRAGILDDRTAAVLISAFGSVPRDLFLDDSLGKFAMDDEPMPAGFEQVTPAPSLIARFLGLLGIGRGVKVLEIGCGTGYTAAVMAAAGARVFSVENNGFLAQSTRKRLDKLSFQNVIIHRGDGEGGWTEHAPYDAILYSKVMPQIPGEIFAQLKAPGGRLAAPVGERRGQVITLWEAAADGVLKKYSLEPCQLEG